MKFLHSTTNLLSRYLFGNDIFISYSRVDAAQYAEKLSIELKKRNYHCYIDRWGSIPGSNLPKTLITSLLKSSMLVILGTDEAINSNSILIEIELFVKTKRTIIPIDFGSIRSAKWYNLIEGLAVTKEKKENLIWNNPSDEIIQRIANAFNYQTISKRRRKFSVAIFIILLALGAVLFTTKENLNQKESEAKAKQLILEAKKESENFDLNNAFQKATQAFELERENSLDYSEASLLISKITNTGIPKEKKINYTVRELKSMDSLFVCLGTLDSLTSILSTFDLEGLELKKIEGQFEAIAVNPKFHSIVTCQYKKFDEITFFIYDEFLNLKEQKIVKLDYLCRYPNCKFQLKSFELNFSQNGEYLEMVNEITDYNNVDNSEYEHTAKYKMYFKFRPFQKIILLQKKDYNKNQYFSGDGHNRYEINKFTTDNKSVFVQNGNIFLDDLEKSQRYLIATTDPDNITEPDCSLIQYMDIQSYDVTKNGNIIAVAGTGGTICFLVKEAFQKYYYLGKLTLTSNSFIARIEFIGSQKLLVMQDNSPLVLLDIPKISSQLNTFGNQAMDKSKKNKSTIKDFETDVSRDNLYLPYLDTRILFQKEGPYFITTNLNKSNRQIDFVSWETTKEGVMEKIFTIHSGNNFIDNFFYQKDKNILVATTSNQKILIWKMTGILPSKNEEFTFIQNELVALQKTDRGANFDKSKLYSKPYIGNRELSEKNFVIGIYLIEGSSYCKYRVDLIDLNKNNIIASDTIWSDGIVQLSSDCSNWLLIPQYGSNIHVIKLQSSVKANLVIPGSFISSCSISAKGGWIYLGFGTTVRVWSLNNITNYQEYSFSSEIEDIAISNSAGEIKVKTFDGVYHLKVPKDD
jgi:hypothetical protein